MKLRQSIFFKLFSLMVIGFTLVFIIQYLARALFFDTFYINNIHSRNIDAITIVADRVNEGEELYQVMYELELTDLDAFIIDEDYDIEYGWIDNVIMGEESYEYIEDYDYLEDYEFHLQGDVYYEVFEDNNAQHTVYYITLNDSTFLVFEQYLYGLMNANDVLSSIDLYIVITMIVFLIPYTYWYSRRISKPLQEMNYQVNALSHLEFLEPLEVTSKDEIGQLTESINKVSKNLEEAIGKLKEDIEFEQYKDKKRRELIASLSHELKTPITTLRAVTEGMRDKVGKYSNRDEYLSESLEYLHYMETLSKNLIDAINIESKTITTEKHNLLSIYNQSLRFVTDQISKKQQKLISNIQEVDVKVNKEMITRVFINLLSNASKYSDNDEMIEVSSIIHKNNIEISILNTGSHISLDDIDNLFEPFYRVEKSRNKDTGGSGLGLFIIKTILDGHKSSYSIKNTPNGVKFTFTLKLT